MRSLSVRPGLAALVLAVACAAGTGCIQIPEREAWEDAWEENAWAWESKATSSCSGVVVPDQSGFSGRVALTFDDGPNLATTPGVLETLREHGVPATFFINSGRVLNDAARAALVEVVEDPLFILANHSRSHANLVNASAEDLAWEIDAPTMAIEAAGGEPRYFRFPYGSSNCTTAAAVRERGYRITGWHVDSADWCFAPDNGHCPASRFAYVDDAYRSDMPGFVMSQVRSRNGGIVLFHDIHYYTASVLEEIILALKDEGYTFTSVDDADAFPLLNEAPEPEPEPEPPSDSGLPPGDSGSDAGVGGDSGMSDGGTFAGVYCTDPGQSCGGNEPCWPASDCPAGSTCDWSQVTWGLCMAP